MSAVALSSKRSATYRDLIDLPENLVGEIIDGELIASPRPAFSHAHAVSALAGELGDPFSRGRNGPGGWWILFELELHLGADVLVPDLAGWRRTRMPKPPPEAEPFLTLAPDWLCEVLSPSTRETDRRRKLPIYAREGVERIWLIDPALRSLEVLRRKENDWKLISSFSEDKRVRAEPFDAIELELDALWPRELPGSLPSTDR